MSESARLTSFGHSEIWKAANTLIDTHGERAPNCALCCAGLSLEVGNLERARRWRLVWEATRKLLELSGSGDRYPN